VACSLKFVLTFNDKFRWEVRKKRSMRMGGAPTRCAPEVMEEEQREDIERTL
jgi:hypothetical protein